MTAYNVVNPASLASGQPEDVSQVLANFQAIAGVLNGGIDNGNVAPTAAIAASKLANYPSDGTKFLRGDGVWVAPASLPPVVNGQFIKGVGGAAVWAPVAPSDISGYPSNGGLFLRGDGAWAAPPGSPLGGTMGAGIADPGYITSTSRQMMGFGSTWRCTLTRSGSIFIFATGFCDTADVSGTFEITYGVGAAPANGAAYTGSGATIPLVVKKDTPFAMGVVVGIGVGQTVWCDVAARPASGGNITRFASPTLSIAEL